MAKNFFSKITLLLFLAFLVRLFFIYPQFSGDVKNHIVWGQSIVEQGTDGFYQRHFAGFNDANYPPVIIFLFAASFSLFQFSVKILTSLNQSISLFPSFIIPFTQTVNFQAAFLKLPAIAADLGIGLLIYKLTKSKLLPTLYLFNPAVIYVSTVWGQIESIPIFFILLSLYFLKTKKHLPSHIAFTLAILTKQTALWLAPIFIIYWYKKQTLKQFFAGITLQILVFIIFYLPFTNPINAFFSYLSTLSGSTTLAADNVYNLWHFLLPPNVPDSLIFFGLSVRLWSVILLSSIYLFVCLRLFAHFKKENLYLALFSLSMAAFFLQTRVHEKHLFPALVFLLLINSPKKIPYYLFFIILSAYHMLDLYQSLQLPFL